MVQFLRSCQFNHELENAQQSLCRPSNSETKPTTDQHSAKSCPLVNLVKLTQVLIDICCIQSSVMKSGVTGWKLPKFLPEVNGSSPPCCVPIFWLFWMKRNKKYSSPQIISILTIINRNTSKLVNTWRRRVP